MDAADETVCEHVRTAATQLLGRDTGAHDAVVPMHRCMRSLQKRSVASRGELLKSTLLWLHCTPRPPSILRLIADCTMHAAGVQSVATDRQERACLLIALHLIYIRARFSGDLQSVCRYLIGVCDVIDTPSADQQMN